MTGWRPASKRPRDGQRVICHFKDRPMYWDHLFASGYFSREANDIHIGNDSWPWSMFVAWIPESELIKQARAAGKSGAK